MATGGSGAGGQAAIAAHRFGLAEPELAAALRDDPRGWLRAQIGPADPQREPGGEPLASAAEALTRWAEWLSLRRRAAMEQPADLRRAELQFGEHFRPLVVADLRARLATAASTTRPFAERLALFWCNHFTVSMAKASTRGLVGTFEREAVRPRIAGRFEELLHAATTHPAMLRYLDNEQSAGPRSRVALRRDHGAPGTPRIGGLNENLAREVLELHTLGAAASRAGIYTQADVTAFAAVLTGWRVPLQAYAPQGTPVRRGSARFDDDFAPYGDASPTRFQPAWHEPGTKTVLGRRWPEGHEALPQLLQALARHPATAEHVSTRLARHFAGDDPPRPLVERLVRAWRDSDGELPVLYRVLIDAPEVWQPRPLKLKSPEEMVLSSARLLRLGDRAFGERLPDGGIAALGQRVQAAPSPAGWPDTSEEWLGPDAVWKRVEWATRLAERSGPYVDARALASASLGPLLSDATATQIERAADAGQALALLLLSPEFQRR